MGKRRRQTPRVNAFGCLLMLATDGLGGADCPAPPIIANKLASRPLPQSLRTELLSRGALCSQMLGTKDCSVRPPMICSQWLRGWEYSPWPPSVCSEVLEVLTALFWRPTVCSQMLWLGGRCLSKGSQRGAGSASCSRGQDTDRSAAVLFISRAKSERTSVGAQFHGCFVRGTKQWFSQAGAAEARRI